MSHQRGLNRNQLFKLLRVCVYDSLLWSFCCCHGGGACCYALLSSLIFISSSFVLFFFGEEALFLGYYSNG